MPDFTWDLPYPSRRMPVMAKNIVAASQPLAAQAGLRMLLKGGNAVDAAIATAIALTVVEPTSNGLGSDAFVLVWDENEGKLHGLNASGRSPAAWSYDHFSRYLDRREGEKEGERKEKRKEKESGRKEKRKEKERERKEEGEGSRKARKGDMETGGAMPRLGWDTVTVPGAVSAWVELSERFGALTFEDLFQPAIFYARNGFPVSPITARVWGLAPDTYQGLPDFAEVFLPGGRVPVPGEIFRNEHLAHTMERISWAAGDSFYHGDIADQIVEHARKTGGLMTLDDLASHSPEWVDPISMDYRGFTLHEIPPNGQGIAALQMLGILELVRDECDIADYPVDSADSIHLQIEAMKLAFADTHRYVSDPRTMEFEPEGLLRSEYLKERAGLINMERAHDPGYGVPGPGGTVYLTTADEDGMMVSYIQSNYMGFGSGIVVPGTGIALQNRGTGFSLEKGHPNQVDGGKQPFHTIIPAFVTKNSPQTGHREPVMSFGVMGGPMQPQGHAQMMIRMFEHAQNPQAAIDAPRWQVFPDMEVALEPGFSDEVIIDLSKRGHRITQEREFWWFGGAQAIAKLSKEHYVSGSDPRKDGQAVGY